MFRAIFYFSRISQLVINLSFQSSKVPTKTNQKARSTKTSTNKII